MEILENKTQPRYKSYLERWQEISHFKKLYPIKEKYLYKTSQKDITGKRNNSNMFDCGVRTIPENGVFTFEFEGRRLSYLLDNSDRFRQNRRPVYYGLFSAPPLGDRKRSEKMPVFDFDLCNKHKLYEFNG